MQALSTRKTLERNAPEEGAVGTADDSGRGSGRGLKAGDRLPTAVSLVSRNVPESSRNEVKAAYLRYGKSMTDLAKSARKLYKSARLRNVPSQQRLSQTVDLLGLKAVKSPEQGVCAITERLTKLFLPDPSD
ncbi:uncharacterized protein LOC108049912 isoform X2 [Drosophila rhopaloa]|nr:uncharacterized protein LOC108049912 isoform X2 [Drosophila rhopaloa]